MPGSSPPASPRASENVERAAELREIAESRLAEAAVDAKRLTLEALYVLEADRSSPATAVAGVLLTLGSIRETLGELDAAETAYRRTLSLLEKAPRTDERDRLCTRALARLGQVYCLSGRYAEADALASRRLAGGRAGTNLGPGRH